MSEITLYPGQSNIFSDLFVDKTVVHAVAVCSRGFGKSHLGATAAIQACSELMQLPASVPNKLVTITAPTYSQVTDVYYDMLLYQLGLSEYALKPSKDTGRIPLPNNVLLRLVSFEAVERLRGGGIYFAVNDETRDWTSGGGFKDAWQSVLEPCISTRWGPKKAAELGAPSQGRSLTITTPKGYDFTYEMFNMHETDKRYKSYHFDYTQSPMLDPAEIELLRHSLDPVKFGREYLASFAESGNSVFYCFNRKIHVRDDLRYFERGTVDVKGEDVHVGVDFNVAIQASTAFAVRGKEAHFLDEFRGSADTEALAVTIKAKYWPNYNNTQSPEYHKKICRIYVYPDASGRARKTSAPVGYTDFSILESHGFIVIAPSKNPPIVDSVACVNRMLKTAAGETTMYIHSRCKGVITSLERTTWVDNNSDTAMIDKSKGEEHHSDSVRYPISYLFPIHSGKKVSSRGFGF
jgi:hypothetical protein